MAARAPPPPPPPPPPPRFREAFILLPDLRRHPDPRPAPAAPSPRAASRCGDRAGRSAAPGAGGRFVGGGRHRRAQPPSRHRPPPRSRSRSRSRSRPRPARSRRGLEMLSGLRRRLPPLEATHGGRCDGDRPRGDEAYGKKDQRPRGSLFPFGRRGCAGRLWQD
ncbi:uncharacterized protein LOC135408463 isoform X2 [Pseudopipra pipra]|uniref:uncharacterized protein LOC135408463 isoform X2 n=1 Tax=Pseudopipra pipra TaxID=415032 RepID=UPI003139FAAA